MARDFDYVCDQVLACIPKEARQNGLLERHKQIKFNAGFRPPEMMGASWEELNVFCERVADSGRPLAEWQAWEVKMYSALSTIPEEDIWADLKRKSQEKSDT